MVYLPVYHLCFIFNLIHLCIPCVLCCLQVYGRMYRVVEPKRARLHGAMTQLAEKQASLAEAQTKLQEVGASVIYIKGSCLQIA